MNLLRANVIIGRRTACAVALLVILRITATAAAADPVILLTADSEGHLFPCAACPSGSGFGGLERRATLITHARSAGPVLLIDAGNWLAGPDTMPTRGQVVTAAYAALGYDAVHLTPRELYWGKDHVLAMLKGANLTAVSANILDAATGDPLVAPYVLKDVAGQKLAVLGVSEPPPGLMLLPHVRQQLAGVRIRAPEEAIDEWLPKAKAGADHVLIFYHGRAKGLRALRSKLKGSGAWILASGVRPENVVPGAEGEPPVLAAHEHGKSMARASLGGGKVEVTQVMVTPDLAPDAAIQKLLVGYAPPPLALRPEPTTNNPAAVAATAPAEPTPIASAPDAPAIGLSKLGKATATAPAVATPTPPAAPAAPAGGPATSPAAVEQQPPPRVTARQPHKPRGLEGVGLTADQVNAAIDRGATYLYDHLQARLKQGHLKLGAYPGPDLLTCLALIHAGVHKKHPEFDKQLREFLGTIDPIALMPGTYENGVLCMVIEDYGDPTLLPLLQQSTRRLIEQQGEKGTWTYHADLKPADFEARAGGQVLRTLGGRDPDAPMPGVEFRRNTPWERGADGDNSATQFAVLGLRSASRSGFKAPAESWRRTTAEMRRRQCVDGGWGYENPGPGADYGSMTCAGICTLAIARHELGESDPAADESIERGLGWLAANFTVAENPRYGPYHYYYLYSLERVGQLLATEFVGPHEWYPLGARFLVDAQRPDGRWVELRDDEDPIPPVSFALLFLTRATPTLKVGPMARGGRGNLVTVATIPPPSRVHIILDGSGSMLAEMNGRPKLDVARDALSALAEQLPLGTQVGLRVYGHRKRSTEPEADQDSALELPITPLNPTALRALLGSIRARGKTPLTYSLKQAANDVSMASAGGSVTVLLLTDGGDDTASRGGAVEAAAGLGKIRGLTLHVIGFDIPPPAVPQLREIARVGNGQYWTADRPEDLQTGLAEVLLGAPEKFTVVNAAGAVAGEGRFGTSISLPDGKYKLVTRFGGRDFTSDFWINTGRTTAVIFDSTEALSQLHAPATAPVVQEKPAEPPGVAAPAANRRFCTSCGARWVAGAKFCTSCGAAAK